MSYISHCFKQKRKSKLQFTEIKKMLGNRKIKKKRGVRITTKAYYALELPKGK